CGRYPETRVQFQGIGLIIVPQGAGPAAGLKYRRRTKGIQQPADVKVCRLCYIFIYHVLITGGLPE
ncbi:MAG: hypothetical protein IKH70_04105, partial [Stomatobaculum sp.]|nr:hypothetical protein [Stomatobaculum sp.]